jgi:Purple acid Phosphatase, N-terminal domain
MRLSIEIRCCTPNRFASGEPDMNAILPKLIIAAAMTLPFSTTSMAQLNPYTPKEIPPPTKRAARVHITQGPELESARSHSAIIRWTSKNPGGSDEHFGVVTYGTDPTNLSQTAKSHIRLNRQHPYTVFRVWVDGLQARTTYYYKVDSVEADGASDGVKSPVKSFTTR